MEVWSGSIPWNTEVPLKGKHKHAILPPWPLFPADRKLPTYITGVTLIDPSSNANGQCDQLKDAKLSICSLVNPALIPLYARAGPSLEFHSSDIETSQWLKSRLLSNIWLEEEEIEKCQLIQCPVGLLITVEQTTRRNNGVHNISDLLVYGILSNAGSLERPPTPPISSSPDIPDQDVSNPAVRKELRIYAVPLSDAIITKAQGLPTPPLSPADRTNENSDTHFAEFLPDVRSPSPKRKRVATLFEVAAQHHKRVRQKGGEAVSQLMASTNSQPSSQLHSALRIKKEPEEHGNPALERRTLQRSRSLSVCGGNARAGSRHADLLRMETPRPSTAKSQSRSATSRKSTPNPVLAESFSRPSESSLALPASQGNSSDPLSGPKDAATIVAENKHLITRTILTCMRLYGFHRRTSKHAAAAAAAATPDPELLQNEDRDARTPAPDSVPLTTATASGTDEDEFKAMYHATYKASTFALRKYLKEVPSGGETDGALPPVLEKEKAMNVIDGFLRLFCEEN